MDGPQLIVIVVLVVIVVAGAIWWFAKGKEKRLERQRDQAAAHRDGLELERKAAETDPDTRT